VEDGSKSAEGDSERFGEVQDTLSASSSPGMSGISLLARHIPQFQNLIFLLFKRRLLSVKMKVVIFRRFNVIWKGRNTNRNNEPYFKLFIILKTGL